MKLNNSELNALARKTVKQLLDIRKPKTEQIKELTKAITEQAADSGEVKAFDTLMDSLEIVKSDYHRTNLRGQIVTKVAQKLTEENEEIKVLNEALIKPIPSLEDIKDSITIALIGDEITPIESILNKIIEEYKV